MDGARAIAAFAVVLHHAAATGLLLAGPDFAPRSVRHVATMLGQVGVAAFFVLLFNLIADLAYGWLDPRVRVS